VNTAEPRHLTSKILRWTARVLGTLLILLFLVFLIGEGAPKPSMLTIYEKLMFAALGAMLLGLIVAWRWAVIGGLLALSGYLLCGLLAGPRLLISPFVAGGVAGCLHLLAWCSSDRSKWRERGGPKRLGFTATALAGVLLIIWLWLGAGARSMEARVGNLPNLAGRWVGTSFVSDALLHNQKVDLDIAVSPDGAFQGRVGDATIVNGHVELNLKADRMNYLLNLLGEPSYRIVLELSGPPLATPRRSLPSAHLNFDLRGGQMLGDLHLTDRPMELRDLHVVLRRIS